MTRVCQRAAHLHLVILGEAHKVRVLHGQQVLHLRLTNPWIWSQDSGIPGTDRISVTVSFSLLIHWDLIFRAAARSSFVRYHRRNSGKNIELETKTGFVSGKNIEVRATSSVNSNIGPTVAWRMQTIVESSEIVGYSDEALSVEAVR